ncbi:MAG: aminomethyl-transferring glycine dehydrogenase subunit GcvPB, partial [candidate division WOR-3 bacterium]
MNHHVDKGFYPLGSCTMKYNPKVNEQVSRLPGFVDLHPSTPDSLTQGALRLMYELATALAKITGFDAVTLQPAAGAHGELTGIMMVRKYFEEKGEQRTEVLVPDSAHGTNPASVTLSGFKPVSIRSNERGEIDI